MRRRQDEGLSMMGSGGLIVMDEDNCMVDIAKFFLEFTVDESCPKGLLTPTSSFLGNCTKLTFFHAGATFDTFIWTDNMRFFYGALNCTIWTGPCAKCTATALIRVNNIGKK